MTVDRDRRIVLRQQWAYLTDRWDAAIPDIDPDTLTEEEVAVEIAVAVRRRRALNEGTRAGWTPPARRTA